ncbi:MAG: alpha-amylase family glycosyl hydrolase [Gallintestinimicrobium sp.]
MEACGSRLPEVQPNLGTMEELASLCSACHEKKMSVCMDFVMNHTSEDHEWAKRALAGEKEYQDRYFSMIHRIFRRSLKNRAPGISTTAPGNFTWRDECKNML